MENRNYCVYCHTNKQNGKKYIGITCQKPEQRWRNGKGYKDSPRFWNSISLHGWDAFTHEIWYTGLTKKEAEDLEIELIAKYETQNPMKGYNIAAGGNVVTGMRWKLSEETKKKMSEAAKNLSIEKQINRLKGRGYLPVQCLETGVIYYCTKAAGEFAGISADTVKQCVNGKCKTAGGYHWQRVTWEEYEAQEAAKGGDVNGSC